jgi:hypothetical protein
MTVQELIDKLSELPRDQIVVRVGYEGGVAEVTELTPKKIKLHVNPEWYYGPHEIVPFHKYQGDIGRGVLVEDWDMEAVLIS